MRMNKILSLAILLSGFGFSINANANEQNEMIVYKTPYCGCCTGWAEAVAKAGYKVKAINVEDLTEIKQQANVTDELAGCHTTFFTTDFGEYILEGHVPLQAIDKLLKEKPDIRGIAAPGMPAGSLGMGYDPNARYNIYAFSADMNKKPILFYQAGQ